MLERAVLDAVMERLSTVSTVGWKGLTMKGVAAGAPTGRAAGCRRRPSKDGLVADALRAGLPRVDGAPELGSVRADLPALCRQARDAMYSRPGVALRVVIHECDPSRAERFHGVIFEGVVERMIELLCEVIVLGADSGEVHPDAAHGYVFDSVPAIMMYRSKMCTSELSDRDLEEMIDRPMVPLLRPDGP
ncbi:TetR-like C-terminal domain-containing protein [Streptomyces sp. NPDC005526]|uniref:TetR-like C-terminal domain-containing protein n=1 Tax=Streptomyces sp. NPDC005526 TaxID=3156885 RepID=UPI0033AB1BD2